MLIKSIILILYGLSAGFVVSAGVFAFITMVGVLIRLAVRTNTAKRVKLYEDIVVVGATVGNIVYIYDLHITVGPIGLIIFGIFSGSFIGCLAVALEETLQVFPILATRVKLKLGMPIIVLGLAFGKGLGAFYQLYIKG
jgi:stage V sporulation protein AB